MTLKSFKDWIPVKPPSRPVYFGVDRLGGSWVMSILYPPPAIKATLRGRSRRIAVKAELLR